MVVALALSLLMAQSCTIPDPFVAIGGGVCVQGGWVPAVLVTPDPLPTVPDGAITSAPESGSVPITLRADVWPAGEVSIDAPLTLLDLPMLNGAGPTVIKPSNADYQGVLINLRTSLPGNPDTGYPVRSVIRDLYILCSNRTQIGLAIRGANIVLERVTIANCGEAIRCEHCINVTLIDPNLLQNTTGFYFAGYAPNTVTTVKIRGGIIGGSGNSAVVIRHGKNVTLDGTILEYNAGCGIDVTASALADVDVQARDVWFEQNARGHICGMNRVVLSGSSAGR